MHPIPAPEVIAGFYPASYDIYEENTRTPKIGKVRRIILSSMLGYRHLDAPVVPLPVARTLHQLVETNAPAFVPDGILLDIGCGNGRFLSNMQALGWNAQGVEFSETGVQACRKSGLAVHHGTLESAAFASDSFDVVTARHLIEHLPDPSGFVREVARILKPGGTLLLETPNADSLGRAWLGPKWFANEVPRHIFLFNEKNLELLLTRNGLQKQASRQSTTPKILLNSVDYVILNRGRPSKRKPLRRLLAKAYTWIAQAKGRGDILHLTYTKPRT